MKDEIFWGNLKGLLKNGKWSLSLEESSALLLIYKEVEERSRPPVVKEMKDPIKVEKKNANK
jgi:hypothetical protein